jgi:hypothetical protein
MEDGDMKSCVRIPSIVGATAVLGLIILGPATPLRAATPDEAPPVAAGQSRVWFLRPLLPGEQFHAPMVFVNGAPITTSGEGTAFYRDFAPGQYVFSVENCLPQQGASQTLNLRPNTQFALEVQQDDNGAWDCNPPQISYLRQVQPEAVPYKFSPLTYLGAR